MISKEDLEDYMEALRDNFERYGHDQREEIQKLLDEHFANIKAVLHTQNKLNARLMGFKI